MLHNFSEVVGLPLENGKVQILPYQDFRAGRPFKGTKFLLAELDEIGRGLLLTFFEQQLRKFNNQPTEDSRFVLDSGIFERFNPRPFEIDYQMLPDGKYEIVAILAEEIVR